MRGEAQRERESALLPLGGMGTARHGVERHLEFVAMGAHRRHTSPEVVGSRLREGLGETLLTPGRAVGEPQLSRLPSQAGIGLDDQGFETRDDRLPLPPETLTEFRHPAVPHVERHRGGLIQSSAGLLEQDVALAYRSVEVASKRVVPRGERHEGLIHEPSPLTRGSLDQHEIIGGEHRRPHHAQEVADARQTLTVDLDPARPRPRDLALDQ